MDFEEIKYDEKIGNPPSNPEFIKNAQFRTVVLTLEIAFLNSWTDEKIKDYIKRKGYKIVYDAAKLKTELNKKG